MTMWAAQGPVSSSDLYEIDPSDGSTITNVGAIGFGLTGMAVDPTNGTLYGVTSNISNSPRRLITIDKVTGAGTIIGQLLQGGVARTIADIGFDSTGTLWGFNVSQNRICTINKATGAVTNIGSASESGSGNGFDLDSNDDYFLLSDQSSGNLYQIDKTTGVGTIIVVLDDATISDAIPAACFAGDKFYAVIQDPTGSFGVGTNPVLATVAYTGHVTLLGKFAAASIDALASDVAKTPWYQPPVTLNAEDYANLSSPTVSLTADSPDWVRDEQYREYDFVNFDATKGNFDYTPTLIIPAGTVPAGRYRLELYSRAGSNSGGPYSDGILYQIENGGEKMNPCYGNGWSIPSGDDGVAEWYRATEESGGESFGGDFQHRAGGPLFVDTSKEIRIAIGQTSENEVSAGVPRRWLEVQKLKFTAVSNDPLPARRWINMKAGAEPWPFMIEGQTRFRADPNDPTKLYLCGHFYNNISSEERYLLAQYEVTGNDITLLTPGGLGDTDLKSINNGTHGTWWRDFTIMPNGDIYLISQEQGTLSQHAIRLLKWDGASWTLIDGDVGGHTAFTNWWQYTCAIDNDGTDVYLAWGEHRSGGAGFGSNDWGIRVKKYDVSGNSFSELGTSSGNGLTAYPAQYDGSSPYTLAGSPRSGLRLRCAPDGTPWLMWAERSPVNPGTFPTKNEIPFVYYWDGAAWQDSGYQPPAVAPPDFTGHSYDDEPTFGNNYTRVTDDDQDPFDMIFYTADGSPSNYPSIIHEYAWSDEISNLDWIEWVYSEFNGSTWSTHLRVTGKQLWTAMHDIFQIAGYEGAFWSGGMKLGFDGTSIIFATQCSQSLSGQLQVGAARLLPDGSAWQALGGDEFVSTSNNFAELLQRNMLDTPTNPGPYNSGGDWIDVIEPIACAGTRIVGAHHWDNGWMDAPPMLTLWTEAGGVVSMNWRSADRGAVAQRVLVGH